MSDSERIAKALEIAEEFGGIDGGDHKMWVIDQMVRALTGCPTIEARAVDHRGETYAYETQGESDEYRTWVTSAKDGEYGPDTYERDEGIAP